MAKVCSVEGCSKAVKGRGYCQTHYARWRRNGDPTVSKVVRLNHELPCSWCGEQKKIVAKGLCRACYQRQWQKGYLDYEKWEPKTCSVDGCDKKVLARGWCDLHYERWKRNGHLEDTRPKGWGAKEKHPLYNSWHYAKRYHPGVCKKWNDFWKFVEEVGCRPTPAHVLRRKKLGKKMSPNNYEWVEKSIIMEGKNKREKKADFQRKRRLLKPEDTRRYDVWRRYNISYSQYLDLLEKQDHKCAVCGKQESGLKKHSNKKRDLAVDHDHNTGMVRGLLCSRCNTGLGLFNDSTETLKQAIRYLTGA